jgi:hypothetical protein
MVELRDLKGKLVFGAPNSDLSERMQSAKTLRFWVKNRRTVGSYKLLVCRSIELLLYRRFGFGQAPESE